MKVLPQDSLSIDKVDVYVFRAPIINPVRTSFGEMLDRPALFVRITDKDGAIGWGEVWCNFPSCGADHRARLIETVLSPLLVGKSFPSPVEVFKILSQRTAILAIQSGEPGPIAQAISGVDLALWDLCSRRAKLPLWRYLGGHTGKVSVYASGINPDEPQETILACQADGHTAFKLKIGFAQKKDLTNLAVIRQKFGNDISLMVDANQAWTVAEACDMAQQLTEFDLAWLEEPLRADRPMGEWNTLAEVCSIPLAAGENMIGEHAFLEAVNHTPIKVVQPDIAKWGGISGCWPVIQAIQAKGKLYCPHYLGAGVGLLASAHLLAAVGGNGLLEIDSNPNPLRSALAESLRTITEGSSDLGDQPGIGVPVDLERHVPMFLSNKNQVAIDSRGKAASLNNTQQLAKLVNI